jgi:hypothetical protein
MNTLKTIRNAACVALASVLLTGVALAGESAKIIPGPKGGKMLTKTAPHAEFFVEKDRKVSVIFYGADLKPVAPTEQVVAVIAEAKDGKVKLDMEKKPGGFVSKQPLPEGNKYQVVVQIREKADAKPVNYRLLFNSEECAECKRPEYACTCDDAH